MNAAAALGRCFSFGVELPDQRLRHFIFTLPLYDLRCAVFDPAFVAVMAVIANWSDMNHVVIFCCLMLIPGEFEGRGCHRSILSRVVGVLAP